MNDSRISNDDLAAFTDICADAYRELVNLPDEREVTFSVAAHASGTVQITLKPAK